MEKTIEVPRMPKLHDQYSALFPFGNGEWRLVQVHDDGRVFVDGVLSVPVQSQPKPTKE
jgi:hypothetical protein